LPSAHEAPTPPPVGGVGEGIVVGGVEPEGEPPPPQEKAVIAARLIAPVRTYQLSALILYISR
jgi:hypothetical protein